MNLCKIGIMRSTFTFLYFFTITFTFAFFGLILWLSPLNVGQTLFDSNPVTNPYFWGTWRPSLYFGLRTLSPETLLSGLLWFTPNDHSSLKRMRHDCNDADQIEKYGYDIHNGLDFAKQTIKDTELNALLTIQWFKQPGGPNGGDWIARIEGKPLSENRPFLLSLVFYSSFEGDTGRFNFPYNTATESKNQWLLLNGRNSLLNQFSMYLHLEENSLIEIKPRITSLNVHEENVWNAKLILQNYLFQTSTSYFGNFLSDSASFHLKHEERIERGNFIASQITFDKKFHFDVTFISHQAHPEMNPLKVSQELSRSFQMIASQKSTEFNERFEATFQLGKKGFSDNQIQMGKHSISSLIGGIGYFHGPILVNYADDDEEEKFLAFFYPQEEDARIQYEKKMKAKEDIRYTEPGSLFTATPSRFFFPRGFLWDEGFHQQVLVHWDPVLSKHCLSSWFDRMNEEGWIAREQILGNEAESKDNPEYRVQSKFIANPPTFFLPLTQLLNAEKKRNRKQKNMLETNEFNKLIVSDLEISTPTFLHKLFPKLEKNFDWYLRTQVGVPDDYGRDINNKFVFRWRGRDEGHNLASGLDDYPRTEPPHVGELHVDLSGWMHAYAELLENMARYLGKNFTYYQQARETIEKNLKNYFYNPHEKVFSDLYPSEDELSTLFSTNKGYLSLIPWLLNFNLRGPMYDSGIQLIKELMTKYGVASLHSSNPAFLQSENYWRGNIWINFQYLILRALHHHKEHDSLHAMSLYTKLRKNLIHTISNNFEETGFLFESYDVNTGNGTRVRPFTGWSSLILLIMSEHY